MKQQKTASPPEVECWMREYGNEILRIAYLYVGDYQTAEDIFQEVFLKAYQGYAGFEGKSSVKTWLIRITINSCKDYLKSAWNRRVEMMSEETEQSLHSPDAYEQVEQKIDLKAVQDAVLSLPEQYKEVILCFFYQELSLEETAQVLSVPVGTVKSRLSRAKDKLKMLMKGGGGLYDR
ncbi:MAG: sigma-70 family RNA polymerase sigma factor [Lachnospiraceae bacterium]